MAKTTINVKGHWRNLSGGGRTWVRPHERKISRSEEFRAIEEEIQEDLEHDSKHVIKDTQETPFALGDLKGIITETTLSEEDLSSGLVRWKGKIKGMAFDVYAHNIDDLMDELTYDFLPKKLTTQELKAYGFA